MAETATAKAVISVSELKAAAFDMIRRKGELMREIAEMEKALETVVAQIAELEQASAGNDK